MVLAQAPQTRVCWAGMDRVTGRAADPALEPQVPAELSGATVGWSDRQPVMNVRGAQGCTVRSQVGWTALHLFRPT